MKDLTDKQSKIRDFIAEWQIDNGYPPTQAEIRDYFKFSSLNAVRSHLVLIEKKGYIRLDSGKARGIHLTTPPTKIIRQQEDSIPLLGNIAAGIPIWAEQNFEDHLPISPALFGNGELFALHVRGDSMTGAGIRNGDIAVIQRQDVVENGEIAAVLIENEATLKRFYLSYNSLVLKSDNPAYKDLKYAKGNSDLIHILGRYRGIVRTENHRSYS
ncbi:transcriptional repressor LexA [uncultured Desulfosarcina sp.]|uniref:transcriptional repressor LexA n=1 Tax=uncultured Desulfosarcina sp. TaxID=218289 RepID=UPI0029C94F88|nr:transcriptional repressor LexA [uncultured Desulfosarcina sp.]